MPVSIEGTELRLRTSMQSLLASQLIRRLKRHWGLMFLVFVALFYLVPYYYIIHRSSSGVTEIYFADRITDAHRILIDEYNRAHEGKVKVVPIDFPNSDFTTNERKEILARSLRGEGDGIDLLAVDVIWVQRFAKWCEPLDAFFPKKELGSLLTDALYSCYYNGQLMAVPLDRVQGVMYYREDLLRKLPGGNDFIKVLQHNMSWSDFIGMRKKLGWNHPYYVFPAAEYEGLICIYFEALLSLDPAYFTVHGFDFRTKDARRALQLLVDLINKDQTVPRVATTLTEIPSYRYFVQNDALFIRGWNSYDKDFLSTPVDLAKERNLRKAPIPHPAGGIPASMLGGWNLMVPSNSAKKEATVDFVKFLLSAHAQETFYTKGSYYPVISAFYEDPSYLLKYPEISEMKRIMSMGVHRPLERDYTKYSEIIAHFVSLALGNKIPVDSALDEMTIAIQAERAASGA